MVLCTRNGLKAMEEVWLRLPGPQSVTWIPFPSEFRDRFCVGMKDRSDPRHPLDSGLRRNDGMGMRSGRADWWRGYKTTWGAKGDARRRVVLPFRLVDGIKDASLLVERQFFLLQSFNDILAHSLLRVPPNLLQRWLYK